MILDDKCLILHMPKTGGVFIRMLLQKHYGDAVRLASGDAFGQPDARADQHHALRDVPRKLRRLPTFGVVRNPWDWYVSWFHFFTTYEHRPPLFMKVSEGKSLDFPEFMSNLYSYPKRSAEYKYNSFSAEYYRIFGCSPRRPRNPKVVMGRYETVHDDLYAFLETVGVSEACLEEIHSFRKMNPSQHEHYSTYYTPELVEAVYEHNRPIIDEFGYEFETPVSPGS
ncbi:MAG: sulfotransferase family 2 domain-containing protein [Acidimicrobiia bacterium]|nr:sulfotransferase family 2 domain-containing protein [Acidimicrobiia bacterium]